MAEDVVGLDEGAIEVRRGRRLWMDRFRAYRALIDGKEVGAIRDGGSCTVRVRPGLHRIELRVDWARSEPRAVEVPRGGTVTLECRGPNQFAAPYWITFGRRRYLRLDVAEPS
jgi:hypothetical protein